MKTKKEINKKRDSSHYIESVMIIGVFIIYTNNSNSPLLFQY